MNGNETTNQTLKKTTATNPQLTKTPEKKQKPNLHSWAKDHKPHILATICVVAVVGITGVASMIKKGPDKYSLEWINNLSESEWEIERKKVLDICRNPQYDDFFRERHKMILGLFDKVKSAKDWTGETPQGPAFHREHGWYLPNDD